MNKKNIIITIVSVLVLTCLIAFARTTTTDLGLVKPTWTETLDILTDINANSDILEAFANDPLEFDTGERLEDRAGAMWTGNTETFVTLTYQDEDNTMDAVVPVKDEDNMASDSATHLATQQSIKKYVDDTAAGVSTSGTPVDDDFAKFTDASTIEGRSYSEVRTDLGLVIGTNVEAYDTGLLSIAGLTTAANKSIYTTALDTYAVYDLTAFGRSILDDVDASAVRTTLDVLQDAINVIDSDHYIDASIDHEHLAADIISGMTDVTSVDTDYMLVWDATDGALKKVDMAEVRGGADTFLAMTDTPANYTNVGSKMVRVNVGGTALEFTTKTKVNATTAPTVSNDNTEFYSAGSRWVDVTNSKEYVCLDASTGAAVWTETTATATAGLPVADTTGIAKGSVDATKIVRLEVDGLTTETTRVLTTPDKDLILVGTVDKLSVFAATTSAELAGVISNETGSGVFVLGTSPTIASPTITGDLGGELDAGAHSIGFTQHAFTAEDATTTIDWQLGNKYYFTFDDESQTFTFTAPSNPCNLLLVLMQDDTTGSFTVTWPGTVMWAGGTAPTLSTAVDSIDICSFYYDGTNYFGAASLDFAVPE